MRRLNSAGCIEGVESVAVAAAYELDPEAVLSALRRDFISADCVVVVAANWLRAVPLYMVAVARLSNWP